MASLQLGWVILILIIGVVQSKKVEEDQHNIKVSENRVAAQIFTIIDHYKQDDPVGIPGAPIPEPLPVPDVRKSLTMGTLTMKNVKAHGLSKFRIKYVKTNLKDLKVNAGIQLDVLTVIGRYTLSPLFSRTAEGPFSIILKNVVVSGNASLGVERDGRLRTQNINMDIGFLDMAMDFQNLGFFGALFQGVVNSAPTLVFDAMKPFILADAYTKLRREIDTNVEKALGDQRLPNSVPPLDMAIAEARKKVREMGFDPYRIPSKNRTVGLFSMEISNTWIIGLSSFYRVGNITISMENNTVTAKLQVGTQKIDGSTQWDVIFGKGMLSRTGHAQFTVQHIKATAEVSQPLDTRKRPQINDLQFDVGNIQVRMDGAGILDYVVEFVVNILPNLLRYQIMDAMTGPIKHRLQEKLNLIDVEEAIKMNAYKFENMDEDFHLDFKL